ncbi:endonuclease VII domain-containing protein [uncultured Jatrophihabitans sp.]|uniref:endonuclease VII domain-containing protein n=1 Tax=uncultured Jatrophihabitans sp. TaxID=1610747 RepID=UPI0035CB8A91
MADFTRDAQRKDGLSFYCRDCRILRDEASRRKRLGPVRNNIRPRSLVVPAGHQWCPDCGEVKPLSEFPRNKRMPNGYMTYCKPCHNTRTRASLEKNGGSRNYHLRRRYGITAEHADQMLAEQDGLCAICREAPAAHVDHDHASGRVRGLLCFNCNGALGQFRDRADLMLRAADYLQRSDQTRTGAPAGATFVDLPRRCP